VTKLGFLLQCADKLWPPNFAKGKSCSVRGGQIEGRISAAVKLAENV